LYIPQENKEIAEHVTACSLQFTFFGWVVGKLAETMVPTTKEEDFWNFEWRCHILAGAQRWTGDRSLSLSPSLPPTYYLCEQDRGK
jgi:hypothetical protein